MVFPRQTQLKTRRSGGGGRLELVRMHTAALPPVGRKSLLGLTGTAGSDTRDLENEVDRISGKGRKEVRKEGNGREMRCSCHHLLPKQKMTWSVSRSPRVPRGALRPSYICSPCFVCCKKNLKVFPFANCFLINV